MARCIAQYIALPRRLGYRRTATRPCERSISILGYVAGLSVPGAKPVPPIRYKDCALEQRNLPWYFTAELAQAASDMARINWNAETQVSVFADAAGKPLLSAIGASSRRCRSRLRQTA